MLFKYLQPEDWRARCSSEEWHLGIAVFFFSPTKQNHTSQAKNNPSKVVTCDTKVSFLDGFSPKASTLPPGMVITTHTRSSELEYVSGLSKDMLHNSPDVEDSLERELIPPGAWLCKAAWITPRGSSPVSLWPQGLRVVGYLWFSNC